MDFIKILIMFVIVYICSSILSTRKFVNLKVLLYGIEGLVGIGFMVVSCCAIFRLFLLQIINVSSEIVILVLSLLSLLSLLVILLVKKHILCSIRVIEYYIYRKKFFENGYSEVGTITDIKKLVFGRHDFVYYLIIDFNGKYIRSLCFLDNIYSIGENIDVLVYKNHNYVILKN